MPKSKYPERIVPENEVKGVISSSFIRYQFASKFCEDKNVLDVGCGAGYGAFFLSKYASNVIGIDRSFETVAYAKSKYKSDNLKYLEVDAEEISFRENKFGIICCFEAIEHFESPGKHLSKIADLLADEGLYIVSTPNCRKTRFGSDNPFHKWEFNRLGFENLLKDFFEEVDVFGEYRRNSFIHFLFQKIDFLKLRTKIIPNFIRKRANKFLMSTSIEDMEIEDLNIGKDCVYKWAELVCICKKPKNCKNGKRKE